MDMCPIQAQLHTLVAGITGKDDKLMEMKLQAWDIILVLFVLLVIVCLLLFGLGL
ncbi:hypothetical protein J27TS7_17800 [Paenibacillus dendritiformis]|nr:hypothetical protein J27TS7_17800 [Paenibacillus dendritiformis]